MASFRDDTVPPTLLRSMRGLPASARAQAIEGLLGRREWHTALLDGIESGAIRAGEVPHARRNLLLRSTIPEVKDRAVRLIQAALMSRREVVERYRREMDGKQGQLANGQIIYRRECSSCHRLDEDGQPGVGIGPNLSSIRNRTTQEVLLHVLDPNREVAPNFVSYVVSLDDGRTISGIVTDENAASISIRTAAGTLEVVDRTRIDQFVSSGMSLMPEGLEERITPTEMCDLLTYVMGSQSR
ncbi:MAG: c-type cytochrome [Pirellula sp.]